ncbi:hypothetical protein CISIN_1g025632mg [Citrus sinensis]|uniref:Uncharacterized protein n=1 Tax=Citrus sinensis TaxID=2711 RepID=A0A067GXI6_CITSI|nr:hypothetical protein CISIN_1g025632mg [Citrus sinensis]
MEPAKIDWKRIESVFVEDSVYENINAPKWVDLLAPDQASVDDVAWFCRPDCNHPKTAEDFLKTPPSSKFLRSLERLPFGDRNLRDARLKRRGQSQSSFSSNEKPKFSDNSENQNPNSVTPQNQVEPMKMSIKSSSEKNKLMDDTSQNDELLPRLKSTLSARNLFAGKDILNHISDFCNELRNWLQEQGRERTRRCSMRRTDKWERKILQEVFEQKTPTNKGTSVSNSVVEGREARALNVFWFLKPCTLSG